MPPRRHRRAARLLALLLLELLPAAAVSAAKSAQPSAGSGTLLARLAAELAVDRSARLIMLHLAGATTPWAAAPLLRNATLQPVFAAVDRCPDPYHRLRTISAAEIQWQRVQRPQPSPPPRPKKGAAPATNRSSVEEPLLEAAAEAAAAAIEEEEAEEEKEYMVFLLSKPGDYFSRELDALVAAVAPAFPSVLFLRGLSTHHHGLVGKMSLRSLPKLFLFEDSLLKSRYKGPHTLSSLLAFLSTQTGQLPRAAPGRVPLSSLPPEALRFDDEEEEKVEPFPLVLPPAPLPPPRLGPLYWLAWVFLLGQALGPRVAAGSWRRRKPKRSGPGTDVDGAAAQKAAAAASDTTTGVGAAAADGAAQEAAAAAGAAAGRDE